MKRNTFFLTLLAAASLLVACNNAGKTGNDSDSLGTDAPTQAEAPTAFDLQESNYSNKKDGVDVDFKIAYPTNENAVGQSVRAYLEEELCSAALLGADENGIRPQRAQNVADQVRYSGMQAHDLLAQSREMQRKYMLEERDEEDMDGEISVPNYEQMFTSKPLCQTDNYVTYQTENYIYLGGAHGNTSRTFATFAKASGNQLGRVLKSGKEDEMQSLLREGMLLYFSQNDPDFTPDNLFEELQLETEGYIPLPATEPALTKAGLLFTYQQYEIAPYSAGIISFTLPYEQVQPFMTSEAKALIEENEKP